MVRMSDGERRRPDEARERACGIRESLSCKSHRSTGIKDLVSEGESRSTAAGNSTSDKIQWAF
jgi:hypothetical protein